MSNNYTKLITLLLAFTISLGAHAQYCSPTVNSSGIYILQIDFRTYGNVVGGQQWLTGNNGYTQTLSPSSGTIKRYFGGGFFYSIGNQTASTQPYDFRGFADWNNDGDFDDAGEQCFAVSGTVVPASSTTTGNNITPPLELPAGNYRLRFVLKQGSGATPCGSFTGEVEDYIITIPNNVAPVLNPTAIATVNPLLSNETNSNGVSIAELIGSAKPTSSLITDNDDRSANSWYDFVPRGIAIIDQSAVNGSWQYKVGAGTWTNFGAVSSTNALLLLADASYQNYQPGARIRFVPTGPGTPDFTYRAYDGTFGRTGNYINIATTGGLTAFSTATKTTSLQVLTNVGFSEDLILSGTSNVMYKAPFNKAGAALANPELFLNNSPLYTSYDMCVEMASNKLFWIAGGDADRIAGSNIDGTSLNTSLVTGLNYATGIAAGDGKLYYWNWSGDYSSADIYRCNLDGTGITKISGGAGQFNGTGVMDTKDIEYYNNRIYFQYLDDDGYWIASANADGSGFTKLYSTSTTNFGGMYVSFDNNIYWTETNGTLKKMPLSGGALTTLMTDGTRTLGDVMVDAATIQVYFIDNDPLNPTYSLIRKISTAGGTVSTAITASGTISSFGFNPTLAVLADDDIILTGQYSAQQMAALKWKTTTEDGVQKFVLERSVDGINFASITTIAAAGTGNRGYTYQYNDNLANNSATVFYYRVKQVSTNGRIKYSHVVQLTVRSNRYVNVSPNPGKGRYVISLNNLPASPVQIKIYNANGAVIRKGSFRSQTYLVDISGDANGIYYAQLIYGDGTKEQLKLVKQ